MVSSKRLPKAVLIGLACGSRAASGPGVLAVRRQIIGRRRVLLLIGSGVEVVGDKLPAATDRTDPSALIGRIVSGAYSGKVTSGLVGAGVAAISAGAGTFATWRLRKVIVEKTGLPDLVVAACEDVAAYTCAVIATRGLARPTTEER